MYEKITLDNGVRIVWEKLPHVRSASCGIWVESGSRHEPAALSGVSHFLEHMFFKGTPTRTAAQIAAEMDAIGGQANAFTTKENTCFYLKALDIHLKAGLEVLCDMFFNSLFAKEDADLERGVILEEIGMYEDSPEDVAVDRLMSAVYRGSPLARPILGSKKTVKGLTEKQLREYRDAHYRPEGIVVALSGSFPDDILDFLAEKFSGMKRGGGIREAPAVYVPAEVKKVKRLEQNHLALAFPGVSYSDPRRYDMKVLNVALGGGMSSRLFQEVREKRGLCYSIYSFTTSHKDTGVLVIYTAVNRNSQEEALSLIREEVVRLSREGLDGDELVRTREQLKAGLLMGLESTSSRMNHIARSEILFNRPIGPDEMLAGYDRVTKESVRELAETQLGLSNMGLSLVGKTVLPQKEAVNQ